MKFKILYLTVFISIFSYSQKTDASVNMMAQINEMGKFNEKYDIANAINYFHPNLVKRFGGKEKAVQTFTNTYNEYKKQGIQFEKFEYYNPTKIIEYKGTLQASVIQKVTANTESGKLYDENSIIAISEDQGKTWKFIGTTSNNRELIKKVFPDLSPDIEIINKTLQPIE